MRLNGQQEGIEWNVGVDGKNLPCYVYDIDKCSPLIVYPAARILKPDYRFGGGLMGEIPVQLHRPSLSP